MANMFCKTTDIEAVQMLPMFRQSEHNPKVLCATMPEFDYSLWKEYGGYGKKK